MKLECGRIHGALGRLIENRRFAEASHEIELAHPQTCDLNDVERRVLLLLKSISEGDWTLSKTDILECKGILSQLPDLGFESDRPIDRWDCRYDARSRTICWFGREIRLTEQQCLLVEHAWEAWEEGDGWFSKQSAREAVNSVSSDYRPKHNFGKGSSDYPWLFESDGTGRYRLRDEPLSG